MTEVRSMHINYGFDFDDSGLNQADKQIEEFESNVMDGGDSLDNMGDSADDTSNTIQRGFGDASRSLDNTNSLLSDMKVKIAAVGAAAGYTLRGFIMNAAETQEEINLLHGTFADNSREMIDWSRRFARQHDIATHQVMSSAGQIGLRLQQANVPLQERSMMTQEMTQRALDYAHVTNTDIPSAMRTFENAFRGRAGQLRNFGVDLQRTMSTQEIFNEVMRGTEQFAGGAEGATAELTFQMGRFRTMIRDTGEMVGQRFVPPMTRGFEVVNDLLESFMESDRAQAVATVTGLGLGLGTLAGGMSLVAMAWPKLKPMLLAGAGVFAKWVLPATAAVAVLEDLYHWQQGNKSITGELIGSHEEWSTKIEQVKDNFVDLSSSFDPRERENWFGFNFLEDDATETILENINNKLEEIADKRSQLLDDWGWPNPWRALEEYDYPDWLQTDWLVERPEAIMNSFQREWEDFTEFDFIEPFEDAWEDFKASWNSIEWPEWPEWPEFSKLGIVEFVDDKWNDFSEWWSSSIEWPEWPGLPEIDFINSIKPYWDIFKVWWDNREWPEWPDFSELSIVEYISDKWTSFTNWWDNLSWPSWPSLPSLNIKDRIEDQFDNLPGPIRSLLDLDDIPEKESKESPDKESPDVDGVTGPQSNNYDIDINLPPGSTDGMDEEKLAKKIRQELETVLGISAAEAGVGYGLDLYR